MVGIWDWVLFAEDVDGMYACVVVVMERTLMRVQKRVRVCDVMRKGLCWW